MTRPPLDVLEEENVNEKFVRVFLDSEFEHLEPGGQLISIGFAAQCSQDMDAETLYIVLEEGEGWKREVCSDFVVNSVLPLLDKHDPETLSRADAALRIDAWLDQLRGGDRSIQIVMMCDSGWDWEHLKDLYPWMPGTELWVHAANIVCRNIYSELASGASQRVFNETREAFLAHRDQHHALIDALANRQAFSQVASDD